jgi:hypothetical protein
MALNEFLGGQSQAPAAHLRDWEFREFHVQEDIPASEFINAASTLVAAGPPRFKDAVPGGGAGQVSTGEGRDTLKTFVFPIGVVEAVSISQARQLQRLFEIGSKRSYFIPGRNIGQVSLTRTLFDGPSLMRLLMAYLPTPNNQELLERFEVDPLLASQALVKCPEIRNAPGYKDFFINLDSEVFDMPFGIFIAHKDSCGENYGAFYLENAFINSHQMSVSATSTLIAEGVTIQYDRMVPVRVRGLD